MADGTARPFSFVSASNSDLGREKQARTCVSQIGALRHVGASHGRLVLASYEVARTLNSIAGKDWQGEARHGRDRPSLVGRIKA